jgi:hypothetical protein
MEASDAIDVIHFFFEEDSYVLSKESAEVKDRVRETIYKDLYEKTYKYSLTKPSSPSGGFSTGNYETAGGAVNKFDLEEESAPTPVDPMKMSPKPYTPATSVDVSSSKPFGSALDAPIG